MTTLTIQRADLLAGLKLVGNSIASNMTLAVLTHVHIQPGSQSITLTGSDMDTATRCPVPAQVEGKRMPFTLPHRFLQALVASFSEDTVTLAFDPGTVTATLTCGRRTARIKGIEAVEFPLYPSRTKLRNKATRASAGVEALSSAIRRVLFAAAEDITRPSLTAVYMHNNGAVRLVATDGFRLAVDTIAGAEHLPSAIIPATFMKRVQRIARAAGADSVEIGLTEDGRQAFFFFDQVEIFGPVIEANYPVYDKIIPKEANTAIHVAAAPLLDQLQSAKLYAAANILHLAAVGEVLSLAAESVELGSFLGNLPVEVHGEAAEIALNVDYLAQAVKACGSERVVIAIQHPQQPAVIRPLDGDDIYTHVIMPMTEVKRQTPPQAETAGEDAQDAGDA